jgi:hypothetical protein
VQENQQGGNEMSSSTLYRFSGVALIIGGGLAIIGQLLLITADPGTSLWIPGTWLALAGTLVVILGLPGLYFKQIDRAGLLGMIGFVLSFVGFLFLVGVQTFDAFVSPTLAAGAATKSLADESAFLPLFAFELFCGLLLIIGPILFGIATIRAGVLQRWAAIILIVGSVASIVTVALHNWNEISGAILYLAFACFGFLLLSKQGEHEKVSSPSVLEEART